MRTHPVHSQKPFFEDCAADDELYVIAQGRGLIVPPEYARIVGLRYD
jgi:hypothetical protein